MGTKDRKRRRRTIPILILSLHAVAALPFLAAIAVGMYRCAASGKWLDGPLRDVDYLWAAVVTGAHAAAAIIVLFIALCLSALWTKLYRKAAGLKPIEQERQRSENPEEARTLLSLSLLAIYGAVFFCSALVEAVVSIGATAIACFSDSNGSGPLVGMLVLPLLIGAVIAALSIIGSFCFGLLPGWLLAKQMLQGILRDNAPKDENTQV